MGAEVEAGNVPSKSTTESLEGSGSVALRERLRLPWRRNEPIPPVVEPPDEPRMIFGEVVRRVDPFSGGSTTRRFPEFGEPELERVMGESCSRPRFVAITSDWPESREPLDDFLTGGT